jgi:hypothetical protein
MSELSNLTEQLKTLINDLPEIPTGYVRFWQISAVDALYHVRALVAPQMPGLDPNGRTLKQSMLEFAGRLEEILEVPNGRLKDYTAWQAELRRDLDRLPGGAGATVIAREITRVERQAARTTAVCYKLGRLVDPQAGWPE